MIEGSQQLKFGETYAKFVKIRQSGLRNQIVRFCQQNHKNQKIMFLKPEHPVFLDSTY
jgi:hypothetical protein